MQDTSGAILGERAGNASFLIDGLWNNDGFQGGALQNLTQDSVQEFEVVAAGYAAEFGQGSGGVINVITKSGTNQVGGNGFLFTRNDALDASNVDNEAPPALSRYDVGVTVGGPLEQDRAWYFGSFEHISEDRESLFPQDIPAELAAQEDFSQQPETRNDRLFGKYTRRLALQHEMQILGGWERLDQRNRLQSGSALPSASEDLRDTTYLASVRLTSQLSSRGLFEAMFGARGQSLDGTADGDARSFSSVFLDTGRSFQFGPPTGSVRTLDQRYYTGRGSLTWFAGGHTLKGGAEYSRTSINGENEAAITHVLVTTSANFALYGRDGFQIPQGVGFATPGDKLTRIRNNGGAFFFQDDWQLGPNLTFNLGVRYDVDSVFDDANNVSPRLGVAWVPVERTVVRASWGIFYDRYRLGVAQAVPELGGFNGRTFGEANYPRLLADALPFGNGALAIFGIIQRNPFVLHEMFGIPTDAVVTQDNVTTFTGLSPEAFLAQLNGVLASTGIPFLPVDFSPFTGFLRQDLTGPLQDQIRAAEPFETPFNRTLSISVERQLMYNWIMGATYVHRSIENITGLRITNLSPLAREVGAPVTTDGGPLLRTYGPWYEGEYDAMILSLNTGNNGRYQVTAHYTLADATDNLLNSNLALGILTQGAGSVPTDNLDVDFDRGRSNLSVRHAFVASGYVQLPWDTSVSGVVQATSGVYFSAAGAPIDYDGDGILSRRPPGTQRNEFRGPKTLTLDLRVEKSFLFGQGRKVGALIEFFNLTNGRTPRLIDNGFVSGAPGPSFGTTRVPLPGREIQIGVRLSF